MKIEFFFHAASFFSFCVLMYFLVIIKFFVAIVSDPSLRSNVVKNDEEDTSQCRGNAKGLTTYYARIMIAVEGGKLTRPYWF